MFTISTIVNSLSDFTDVLIVNAAVITELVTGINAK